jgi:hypothetical protein
VQVKQAKQQKHSSKKRDHLDYATGFYVNTFHAVFPIVI